MKFKYERWGPKMKVFKTFLKSVRNIWEYLPLNVFGSIYSFKDTNGDRHKKTLYNFSAL